MRILLLLLCFKLAACTFAAETVQETGKVPREGKAGQALETAQAQAETRIGSDPLGMILLERKSRSLPPVVAVPDEPTIASRTAWLLSRAHYLRQPFDDAVSAKFLDRYLDALDPSHMHFVRSDIEEFEKYRNRLDDLTKDGETEPAREIFGRFMQRLEERMTFVHDLLKFEKFDFSGQDRYNLNRREAPWPKDLDEAKEHWRQHLRYEVLQEKLNYKEPKRAASAKPDHDQRPQQQSEPGAAASSNGLPDEIIKNLARRYARTLRAWREIDGGDVLQVYLSALAHVYDPHSDYLGKSTLENFAMSMNLSLFGIGALLQSEDGYCKVKELKPGPALKSKRMKPGDRIVAVAQGDDEPVDVVDMKLSKVVEMIRGPKGTKVRLTVIPVDAADPSERLTVALVRDEIKLEDEEAKAKVIEAPDKDGKCTRLGVIDLLSFYASFDVLNRSGKASHKSTTEDVARLLKKLTAEKVAGIILDLRRNGGGSLEEAINLTGLFIKEGPVVQVRDAQGKVIHDDDPDPSVQYDGPLIVLTSRASASASEILAGALQDYGRALIVGDSSTHGKGTVQSLLQLENDLHFANRSSTNNPGALKITIRKFYRASGSSTQLKGVTPDIVLPSLNNYAEVGEASLENPLAWDEIPGAKFERLNRIQPILPELKKRSDQRLTSDKDFAYLQEDIEIYKKFLADKSVSLNEEARRKEKKENEERVEARKKERKLRPEPEEKVHELTLKQVDLPGLPPPAAQTNEVGKVDSPGAALTGEDDDAETDEKSPPLDVTLKEAKRILLDLISLSVRETAVAGRR